MTDTDMLYMASLQKKLDEVEAENAELRARISELEGKHWNECGQIAHYDDELKAVEEVARRTAECGKASPVDFLDLLDENAKLKELLRNAVEDLRWLTKWHDPCELCGLRDEDGDCPVDLDKGIDCDDIYKWRLEAEALALIGGGENDT